MTTPLPAFHRGRAVLLGDAAHAMAPALAQGGNQAVEDGVVLAFHTAPDADPGAALAAYTADRLPRTTAVVRRAARVAAPVALDGRAAVAVRTALMTATARLMPNAVLRGSDGIADWRPPRHTYAAGAQDNPQHRRHV